MNIDPKAVLSELRLLLLAVFKTAMLGFLGFPAFFALVSLVAAVPRLVSHPSWHNAAVVLTWVMLGAVAGMYFLQSWNAGRSWLLDYLSRDGGPLPETSTDKGSAT